VDETPLIETPEGLLAQIARHPVVIGGGSLAAAFSAASYIALNVAISPSALFANQRPQYVLLACSSGVTCLVALGALVGSLRFGRRPRHRLERMILIFAALTFGLQAGASGTMVSDFHAYGSFSASELDRLFQWTSVLAAIAFFSALVIDAAIAADGRPAHELWWRGAVALAVGATLVGTFVKFTAALTNLVYTQSDELAIGVTGVIAGVLIAASATKKEWWWRVGVGVGLAVSGVGFIELARAGQFLSLTTIGEDSLAIGVGYGVLTLTGVAVLGLRFRESRRPRDRAPYPD
jgi:hypothetical protein